MGEEKNEDGAEREPRESKKDENRIGTGDIQRRKRMKTVRRKSKDGTKKVKTKMFHKKYVARDGPSSTLISCLATPGFLSLFKSM